MRLLSVLLAACFTLLSSNLLAEGTGGIGNGAGGPYLQYHSTGLSAFDGGLKGQPVVIGGMGYGTVAKGFRLGGAGGGGFLWGPSSNAHFGLGFGGAIGQYQISSWLVGSLLIGGGGYAVAKVVSQTDSTSTVEKISTGGFILFHPSIQAEIPLQNWTRLSISLGYFLPNVANLQSLTVSTILIFGKI